MMVSNIPIQSIHFSNNKYTYVAIPPPQYLDNFELYTRDFPNTFLNKQRKSHGVGIHINHTDTHDVWCHLHLPCVLKKHKLSSAVIQSSWKKN